MALVRDLWLPSSLDTRTGPIWPSIEAENFELRPGLIALVQQNQFRGLPIEDPHEHIRNVLEYANTVQYHEVSQDAIKCMLFTFSLRDGAKDWYYSLPSRSYTWGEISQAFLERYFPLHKESAIRDQILCFAQDGCESLYAAWERYKDLLRKCPNHGQKDWLVLQIFYRGLTCASRDLIDMSAGGTIMNKTVEGATMLIENLAFHQFQWYGEDPSSDFLACYHQTTTPQQPTLNQKLESDSACDKINLALVLFDDDDAITSDTQMDAIVQDSVILLDDSFISEPELQSVDFDVEEPPLVDIDDVLLRTEMEKFTFQDARSIDSSFFEPEMEIFMIDDDQAASDVKEASSATSITDIVPQEISTTIHPMTSPIKEVLKLLNHLGYDFNSLNKACRTIDNAYVTCNSLLTFHHAIFYCYAYIIGYSIDDLVGVNPITCASCSLCECTFRILLVHHSSRPNMVRVDIPWDPGGCMAW